MKVDDKGARREGVRGIRRVRKRYKICGSTSILKATNLPDQNSSELEMCCRSKNCLTIRGLKLASVISVIDGVNAYVGYARSCPSVRERVLRKLDLC